MGAAEARTASGKIDSTKPEHWNRPAGFPFLRSQEGFTFLSVFRCALRYLNQVPFRNAAAGFPRVPFLERLKFNVAPWLFPDHERHRRADVPLDMEDLTTKATLGIESCCVHKIPLSFACLCNPVSDFLH